MKISLRRKKTSVTTTQVTYPIRVDGRNLTYIEFLNDKNKVTDFILRDDNGNEINELTPRGFSNVAALVEAIQKWTDTV